MPTKVEKCWICDFTYDETMHAEYERLYEKDVRCKEHKNSGTKEELLEY